MNHTNKIWILLNQDLRTPYLIDVGGTDRFQHNRVQYCIVSATNREEAIRFMRWTNPEIRNLTILESMVVEVITLSYLIPSIAYETITL